MTTHVAARVTSPAAGATVASGWLARLNSAPGWFAMAVCALLIFGWLFPTHRYITPERGIGYALGIVGGAFMLLLLLYPARKRWRWLSVIGSVRGWFQFHMLLGVAGPVCILFHSNFSTGAVNSNVALFCMLTVSGSGLVGRYMYTRIHHGLSERMLSMTELQARAEHLRSTVESVRFLPDFLERLSRAEQQLLNRVAATPVLLRPPVAFVLSVRARLQMNGHLGRALKQAARQSAVLAAQRKRMQRTVRAYVAQRIGATREVSEFQAYTRLFSLWHVLHLPLFCMLLLAGIVHVIAVHVY